MLPTTDLQIWRTHPDYEQDVAFTVTKFREVTDLLLESPNLNSTHLFRADILHDSSGVLKTTVEKERAYQISTDEPRGKTLPRNVKSLDLNKQENQCLDQLKHDPDTLIRPFGGYSIQRIVRRRLIPRKPQLDRPLEQTCYICEDEQSGSQIVSYVPDLKPGEDMPWYHPPVQAIAYHFSTNKSIPSRDATSSQLSIHYIPLDSSLKSALEPDSRLHRTFLSLLKTFIRLANYQQPSQPAISSPQISAPSTEDTQLANHTPTMYASLKDTVLPQHLVQDTYTNLKQKYAAALIEKWVEKTEPSKHVFEDLSIAAFLIELWKQMYCNRPLQDFDSDRENMPTSNKPKFPGFVDIACGNGVLVYILIQEGYQGKGFDARRRKTWDVLDIDEFLEEKLCIPQPFLDIFEHTNDQAAAGIQSLPDPSTIHNGIFKPGTFIISNHADELTLWTPILASLSATNGQPLPFLAIPCCSHGLDGTKRRFLPKDLDLHPQSHCHVDIDNNSTNPDSQRNNDDNDKSGNLKSLRAKKLAEKTNYSATNKSTYACLTRKLVSICDVLNIQTELTLMRIPSTRNIGVVAAAARKWSSSSSSTLGQSGKANVDGGAHHDRSNDIEGIERIQKLIEKECLASGGIHAAATVWVERARKLQVGVGRGKVNLGGH